MYIATIISGFPGIALDTSLRSHAPGCFRQRDGASDERNSRRQTRLPPSSAAAAATPPSSAHDERSATGSRMVRTSSG